MRTSEPARIRSRRPRRRGFTLLEVVIVLGLVALLLGMLLPALTHVTRGAKATVSISNLRSLGQIQSAYANAFRGSFVNPFDENARAGDVDAIGCPCLAPAWNDVRRPIPATTFCDWPCFKFSDTGQWTSEMYAFHWYSLLGSWIAPGDHQSEVQFSPNDPDPKRRFLDAIAYGGGAYDEWMWDTSYLYSPTMWFAADRYAHGARADADLDDPRVAGVRRNKVFDVLNPGAKVILWERLDTSKPDRGEFAFDEGRLVPIQSTNKSPAWNNPGAISTVALVDGGVARIDMDQEIYPLLSSANPKARDTFAPTDLWNPEFTMLLEYDLHMDGLENGQWPNPGLYPAFFWATRNGVQGRDINR